MNISGFKTLDCGYGETTVMRSKFIAYAFHVDNGDEAEARLSELKKKYHDATHICYAYIADILGNQTRFSDAGEPSGTAGKPILDTIIKAGYVQALVAVVRYFGGVKLGTGGLARAYREAAEAAVKNAGEKVYRLCNIYKVTLALSDYKRVSEKLNVLNTEFSAHVTLTVAAVTGEDITGRIMELTNGRASIQFVTEDYIASEQ